jgi:hypothetical protein
VAVIETLYTFWVVALQDRVSFPCPVTLFGVIDAQVSPLGTVSVRLTVPENPFNPVTVMVEFAGEFMGVEGGDVAIRMKSLNLNTAVAERVRNPLVPVIVRG